MRSENKYVLNMMNKYVFNNMMNKTFEVLAIFHRKRVFIMHFYININLYFRLS